MKAIRFHAIGDPGVLRLEDVPAPQPGPGEIRIRNAAIGVNLIDTYHRSGLYPVALPNGLGLEAAGTVEEIGAGVTRFQIGDRVGYCSGPLGAYAQAHVVPADRAVRLPESLSLDLAAAVLLKGMTARYLLRKTHPVGPGEVVVLYAAVGGVGQIASQWAAHLGAVVIGIVGGEAKAELARRNGCAHVLVQGKDDIPGAVRTLSGGEGARVVYDSVGKDTFMQSLDCLAPLGMLVSFGNASGPVPAFAPALLAERGSLFLTRPTLFHYTRTAALLQESADDLFAVLGAGLVQIAPPRVYPLSEAAQAHSDLQERRTTGSLILRA